MFNLLKRVPQVVYNTIIIAATYVIPVLILAGDFPPAGM